MRAKVIPMLFIFLVLIIFLEGEAIAWGGLTHMTILDDILKDPRLNADARKILEENMKYAKGGAVGPDMHYFSGKRYADMAHYCSPGDLARKMLEFAKKDGNPKEIAFAYGWMIHVASDSRGHAWVNSMVGGEYNPNRPEIVSAHRNLEMRTDFYNFLGHAANDGRYDSNIDAPNKFLGKVYKEQYGCSKNAPGSLGGNVAENISQGWYNVEPSWITTSQDFEIFNTEGYKNAYQESIDRAVDALNSAGATLENWDLDTGEPEYNKDISGERQPNPNYGGYRKCDEYGKLKDCSPVKKAIKTGDFPPDDTVSVSDYDETTESESLDSLYRLAPKKGRKWMLWLKAAEDANAEYNGLPADALPELRQEKLDKISTLVSQLNDPSNWREFSENNPQFLSEIEETPDIAVLENGYFEEMVSLINKKKEPVRTVELDFSPTIVETQPVLVIPSGGLYGLEKSEIIKTSLEEYVKQGGTLIVFSQQYGYEFSILPVPQEADGSYKQVGGYGWAEDQSCFYNAAYIETWHQMLAGLYHGTPAIHIDGFFMNYPSNTTVLLRRRANGQPALLMYEYGEGRVIATSMYSDVALKQNQASSEEIGLIRDIMSWAKEPDMLPENKPGESVAISVTLTNATSTDASSVKLLIYNPDRSTLLSEQTVSVSIPEGQSATIPATYTTTPTSALGIYHIDYAIYDLSGDMVQPQAETDSGRFAVSNPPKSPSKISQLNFSIQSDSEDFVWGYPVRLTINAFNNSDMQRTVTAKFNNQSQSMIIPGKGSSSFVHVKTAACEREGWGGGGIGFGWLQVAFYEDDEYLSTASKYYRVYFPSAGVTVNLDKNVYAKGETVAINTLIKNKLSAGWQPTLRITVWDSKGLIFEDSKTLVLPPSGTVSVSTNYTLPTAATVGSYAIGARLYVPKLVGGFDLYAGGGNARFDLPQSQISVSPSLPSVYNTGTNTLQFTVTNTGKINVSAGTIDLSLKTLGGSVIYSESQPFSIAVGGSKTLDVPISIPSLKLGNYVLTYAQSDETRVGRPTSVTIPNSIEITDFSINKPSFKVGDTASLALDIKNTGKFNWESILVTVSAPDLYYSESQSISLGAGGSMSLNFAVAIPETISAGGHNVEVTLTLPGEDRIAKNAGIYIPASSLLIRCQWPITLSAGDTLEGIIIENTGGFDTNYNATFYLYDKTGWDVDIKTGAGFIQAGGQTLLSYTLPDQLTDGQYQVGMEVTDTKTTTTRYYYSPYLNISGLRGNLSVKADKDIYFSNEETITLSTIVNQAKPIVDGNLHLEIACAESASSSPPELQSFQIYTMDSQWQWTEQGVLHFPPYLYRQELALPISIGGDGSTYVRMKHEEAQIAFIDYVALKDSNGNLYPPYLVAANEHDITLEVQAEDDSSAEVTEKYVDAEWRDLPSGVLYSLVMRAWEGNACGIVWEMDTTINQSSGTTQGLNISAGIFGQAGKFYLKGELTNSLGQILSTSYYPFYIIDGDTVLLLNTDKRIYRPGETVTITGKIENQSPITAENLILTLTSSQRGQYPQVLLTETLNLLSGGTYPFTITATTGEEGIFSLSGAVKQNNQTLILITDQYEVTNPLVSTYVDAPQRAGNEPFIIEVDLYNDGKVDATVQFEVQSSELVDSQTIMIPAFGMKFLRYNQQISKDVTYTFTFSGDYQETTTKTVTYGLGASIQFGVGGSGPGVFPEGSVAMPVSITNTGQLAETLAIDFTLSPGDLIKTITYYLQPGSNTTDTLHFNLTEGDYQITATCRRPDATAQANFSARKENQVEMTVSLGTQTDALIPVNISVTNLGYNSMEGSLQLSAIPSRGSGQVVWNAEQSLAQLSPQNSQLITVNINPASIEPGNFTLQVQLLNNSNQIIATRSLEFVVQIANFKITQLPPYQIFMGGQEATFVFRVRNIGDQEGSFDLRLKAYDLIDSTQREWLKPGEEKPISFSFFLPEDLEENDYFAEYELKGAEVAGVSKGQIKYHLAGISLNVNASLDKPFYTERETAHLTINIQTSNPDSQNLFARVNYAGYEPQQSFTLNGNQVLIFDIPLPKITGEKLFYGIYHEGGRSIHLNSLYIHKAGDVITITTDKQVYNPGETVSVSVTGSATGDMALSAPGGYTETFTFTGSATKSFSLPSTVAAGTYFINVQLSTLNSELVTVAHPFDVAGIQVKVLECQNDKGKYASSDSIATSLTISSNTTMPAILKAWVDDPTGQSTSVGELSITLLSSESSLINYNSVFSTSVSGIHRLVYGIYGPEDLLLCSGSEAFDVGDAVLLGLSADRRDYPTNTEPVIVTASLVGSVNAELQLELDGILIKSETISLNGFARYTTQLQDIVPGPHALKAILTAVGLKSTKEASFTYALAFMPKPQISASPAYLDFGNINLDSASTRTITLSSTGNVGLVIRTITLSGTNQGEFSIQNDNCSGRTLAPVGNCTLHILFSPTSLGSKSASLSILSNALATTTLNLQLGGAGAITLNLSINPEGSGKVTGTGIECPGDCTESFSTSGAIIELTATPGEGYAFTKWTGDIDVAENPVTVNMDAHKNVAANFAMNACTINVTVSIGGVVTPSGSVTVNSGASQTFTITPNAGYHVTDVKVDGVAVGAVFSYTFSNVTSDHTIEAIFAINQYTIAATAGENGAISPSGIITVNFGGSQTFTVTPNAGYLVADVRADRRSVGAVTTFTFDNLSSNHTIEVTFEIDNQPPVADAGLDRNVITGQVATLNGTKSFDPEGVMITFLWAFVEVPAGSRVTNASLSDVTSAKPQFTPDVNGTYRLKLIVNDGALGSVPDEVVINANTPNVAPNANAGPDQNVSTGNTVQLDASRSSDPDNGPLPLTYLWRFDAKPVGSLLTDSAIENRNLPHASFIPDVDGLYELMLAIDDGNLFSEDAVQIIAAFPNVPPNANAGADMTINLGDTAVLNGSASNDPDRGPQPLTYLWSFVAVPTRSQLANGQISSADTLSPSFTPDLLGTYVLQLMVYDGIDARFDNVAVTAGTKRLAALGPVKVWLGLKNSDDQGTYFDLRVDLLKNGVTIATGETRDIRGIIRNPSLAKEVAVTFGAISDRLDSADIVSLRIMTKVTASGGHSNAFGLRLYYDAVTRPSRSGMELSPDPVKDYFLHSDSSGDILNNTSPTGTDAKYKDSTSVNRTTYKEIGTWSMVVE